MSTEPQPSPAELAGPEGPGSMQQGLASGGGAPYFESPMLSVDFQSRPLSPPQSKSYGDSGGAGGGGGGGLGGDFRHKQRKAETVLSNLQGAERHEAQKKRADEAQGPPATRLFAPVDSPYSLSMPPSSGPGGSTHGAAPPPGALTNMLMSSRLSSSGMGRTSAIMDDALDLGMSQESMMYGSLFSPGSDLHRALPVGESPKMGQNHMMFPYPGTYLSQPTPTAQTWQFPHHQQHHGNSGLMNLSTPAFPSGSMLDSSQMARQSSGRNTAKDTRRSTSSKRSRRRADEGDEDGDDDYDEDDEDEEEASKPKRKKKAAKPSDPNEPKITSKHRGVCWYKRTKKWVVQTKVNGKRVHVGYFDDEEKAAEAYKKAVQGIQIKKALEAKQRAMTPGSDAGPPALEPGLPIPDAPSTSGINL